MNLLIADWPDDPAELAPWLEAQLCGPHLRELASELAAVFPSEGKSPSLNSILGHHRDKVLSQGLSELPESALRELLRHPALLLELQTMILSEGGAWWDRDLSQDLTLQSLTEKSWHQLQLSLVSNTEEQNANRPPAPSTRPWYRSGWVISLATAAMVLMAVQFWPETSPPPQGIGWGWASASGLPEAESASEYLGELADQAEQWHNKKPETQEALAKRILEFRRGCTILILSEHPALNSEQKTWLRAKCQVWAGKIDGHLAALESGTPVAEIQQEMDATVNQLVKALRDQAAAA